MSLLNYAPSATSYFTWLRGLRAFALYVPSHLARFYALRVLIMQLARLIYALSKMVKYHIKDNFKIF